MSKPHILIFNPDQWRGDVMGHMGNPAAVTPNLDALAATDAISIQQAHCQNPVSTPSRCSFMTGWYPHVRGHRTMYHMLHPERGETNLLKVLKDNGYFVWWGGKNDLVPGQDGYEAYCNIKHHGPIAYHGTHDWTDWRGKAGDDTYYSFYIGKLERGDHSPSRKQNPRIDDHGIYLDNDWASVLGLIEFIKSGRVAASDAPLCMYLPIGFPHPPYGVEDPYYSMIDPDKIPDRIPAPEDWSKLPSLLRGLYERQHMQTWTEERWRELRRTYYGMCARVDAQFGMVVTALKEAGIYDDTALFFMSDHGDFAGDYGLVEKSQNTFEDVLTRVPFILKPPKTMAVQPGVRDVMAELLDMPATLYDMTGIDPGYDHFGKSLTPLLADPNAPHRDAVFCEGGRRYGEEQAMELSSQSSNDTEGLYYPRLALQVTDAGPEHNKGTMCRTKDYKYVRRLYEVDELYDLQKDPAEVHNVIDDPAYREVKIQLQERMLQWYQETCDVVPRDLDRRW